MNTDTTIYECDCSRIPGLLVVDEDGSFGSHSLFLPVLDSCLTWLLIDISEFLSEV